MTFRVPDLDFLSNESNYRRFVTYLHRAIFAAAMIVTVEILVSKSLGGSMTVDSTVGIGATFSIRLPLILPSTPPVQKRRREDS